MDTRDKIRELSKRTKEKHGSFGTSFLRDAFGYFCLYAINKAKQNIDAHIAMHITVVAKMKDPGKFYFWYEPKYGEDNQLPYKVMQDYIIDLDILCRSLGVEPFFSEEQLYSYGKEEFESFAKSVLDAYLEDINVVDAFLADANLLKRIEKQMTILDKKEDTAYSANIFGGALKNCCDYLFDYANCKIEEDVTFQKPHNLEKREASNMSMLKGFVNDIYFAGVATDERVLIDIVDESTGENELKSFAKTVFEAYAACKPY